MPLIRRSYFQPEARALAFTSLNKYANHLRSAPTISTSPYYVNIYFKRPVTDCAALSPALFPEKTQSANDSPET